MRVLQVTHRFPPAHRAGTERYTEALALGLVARGHGVEVFCAEKDVSRPQGSVATREHRGLRVTEFVNNLFLDAFPETWHLPAAEAALDDVLARLRPDVVHLQHLLYLSTGLARVARARGARVVATLHDFSFECARLGQLVHADGTLCAAVDPQRCGTCLPSFPWRQSDLARRVGGMLSGVRRWSGVDLAPLATRVARRGEGGTPSDGGAPDPEVAAGYARFVPERAAAWRRALAEHTDRVLCPSRFLLERALAFGLDPERVEHLPTGVERAPASAADPGRARRTGPLEVLFLGTYVPLKGAQVLLAAWGQLRSEARAAGRLRLHGPGGHAPEHEARLAATAREVGADLGGALDADGVVAALARADLLVVPSTWYENRPLVMLEALAAGVPVLASDAGGMAELVRPDLDGWTFPMGDARALARVLEELLADPARVRRLRPDVSGLPTFEDTVEANLAVYARVLGEAR